MPDDRVRVRVPGTSANLGPGYDCLGIALRVYNTVEVRKGPGGRVHGMVDTAGDAFFAAVGTRSFRFRWSIEGDVPISRGLGSSVTLRLGLLHALNALAGSPLDRARLFEICATLEGHPDNAAPAAFGGFVAADGAKRLARFPVDSALKFVLLIPGREVQTSAARKVLPQQVGHHDAASNAARVALITAAFASRRYALLRDGFADILHQPYRTALLPELPAVIEAGTRAGALGGFLSGSGSTIACVTLKHPERVAAAMRQAFGRSSCDTLITMADNQGARVLGAKDGVGTKAAKRAAPSR